MNRPRVFRKIAFLIVVTGFLLLVRVVYKAFSGDLVARFFPASVPLWPYLAYALGLTLPIPFHVMGIGLILQKRRFSPVWRKIAWCVVATSGCWLGAALVVREFFLKHL